MINCILLVLLLLLSMVHLKYINFHLVICFLNFLQLFHLQALLIIILPYFFAIFFHPKIVFFCFSNATLSRKILVSFDVTSLFTNMRLHVAKYLILNHNPYINITKKPLIFFFLLLHHRLILFLRYVDDILATFEK